MHNCTSFFSKHLKVEKQNQTKSLTQLLWSHCLLSSVVEDSKLSSKRIYFKSKYNSKTFESKTFESKVWPECIDEYAYLNLIADLNVSNCISLSRWLHEYGHLKMYLLHFSLSTSPTTVSKSRFGNIQKMVIQKKVSNSLREDSLYSRVLYKNRHSTIAWTRAIWILKFN